LNILIITYFFPPLNSIASLRPYSWAKYWSRAGHDVTVLTLPKKPAPSDSPQPFDGFRVIEVPIPGMAFLRKIFGRNDISGASLTEFTANGKEATPTTIREFLYSKRSRWQKRYGFFSGCRMPDLLDLWSGIAFKAVKNQHWDLVVSTAWPYGVHRPAYRLKKTGIAERWITDWRDLWTDSYMFPGLLGFRAVERLLERRWSQVADAITTVSEPLADTLREKYGDKVHVIYNGFDPEDYENLPAERILPNDGVFRIVYTGSIYSGKQDPSPLFEAVHNLYTQGKVSPECLRIIFCGINADVSDLARKHSVEEFVEYAGFVPRQQALRMQRDADALLFLEFESENAKGHLTGKLFEFLFAGPPIIGVGVGGDSSAGLMLKKTGRGKCFGRNAEKIAEEIKRCLSVNSNTILSAKKIDYYIISEYSRKVQSEKMLKLLPCEPDV
jgi:glycosyltransferase involved in cell wall biosynthesis